MLRGGWMCAALRLRSVSAQGSTGQHSACFALRPPGCQQSSFTCKRRRDVTGAPHRALGRGSSAGPCPALGVQQHQAEEHRAQTHRLAASWDKKQQLRHDLEQLAATRTPAVIHTELNPS